MLWFKQSYFSTWLNSNRILRFHYDERNCLEGDDDLPLLQLYKSIICIIHRNHEPSYALATVAAGSVHVLSELEVGACSVNKYS